MNERLLFYFQRFFLDFGGSSVSRGFLFAFSLLDNNLLFLLNLNWFLYPLNRRDLISFSMLWCNRGRRLEIFCLLLLLFVFRNDDYFLFLDTYDFFNKQYLLFLCFYFLILYLVLSIRLNNYLRFFFLFLFLVLFILLMHYLILDSRLLDLDLIHLRLLLLTFFLLCLIIVRLFYDIDIIVGFLFNFVR